MTLAAVSGDDVKTILLIVQLVVTVLMAVLMGFVNSKAKRIDTLEGELKRATEQAIDNKLSAQLGRLDQRVLSVEQRLLSGDAHLKRLDERDHTLEVKVLTAISELKDVVATKDDLERLRREIKGDA